MATRPVFSPRVDGTVGVTTKDMHFEWFPGLSVSQKRKSVSSLHESVLASGYPSVLEISSKSEGGLGRELSAFNLRMRTRGRERAVSVECAFQSSKVFERGGPYVDLLEKSSAEAKADPRLKKSGELMGFSLFGMDFPSEPKTLFYDWLYVNALSQNAPLREEIRRFAAFTDIEFNPRKSLNCQAHSAALYVSLQEAGHGRELASFDRYVEATRSAYPTSRITGSGSPPRSPVSSPYG